ncbi:MAG: glycosyltransferase [Patescibacteria group bacterium]
MDRSKIKIAFFSTYPPRECGIATFTKSFVRIFDELYIEDKTKIIALSDEKGKYQYSDRVVFEVDQYNQQSYVRAANFVNESDIEVVSLQHEYGIFGGENGEYIIRFLESVDKPVVTSLHSVLRQHSLHRHRVTQRILDLSDSVVVMTYGAKRLLLEEFNINPLRIKIIPHGVPNVRFDEHEKIKQEMGYAGKTVCLTFGLINRGKGIELAIEAVSRLAKRFPDMVYLIAGATHPDILKREGELYRKRLEKLVRDWSLSDRVIFINRYLDYKELVDYLIATDIYIAPQIDFNQSFSGTLSYALGCGNAIISSPTNYALEILANGRGSIVKPEVRAITRELKSLLSSASKRERIRFKAYQFAREMIWPRVGIDYLAVMQSNLFMKNEKWRSRLPDLAELPSTDHLIRLTDDIGIVQHALAQRPDYRFGYSIDDQARAAIACGGLLKVKPDAKIESLLEIYLSYLDKAVDQDGVIHNFLDQNEQYIDRVGSDDSIGRSFWALGYLADIPDLNKRLRDKILELLPRYRSRLSSSYTQSIAYNLLGFCYLRDREKASRLADILVERLRENSENGKWHWFDDRMTYGNGIIPYALLKAYRLLKKKEYLETALGAVEFLRTTCRYKGIPLPIGQDGWYAKNGKKAIFDQQPLEAGDMVLLYNELYDLTNEQRYRDRAIEWLGWYFGNNISSIVLYNNITHGVCDGLTRKGCNVNQGAESTAVYLLAHLSFRNVL